MRTLLVLLLLATPAHAVPSLWVDSSAGATFFGWGIDYQALSGVHLEDPQTGLSMPCAPLVVRGDPFSAPWISRPAGAPELSITMTPGREYSCRPGLFDASIGGYVAVVLIGPEFEAPLQHSSEPGTILLVGSALVALGWRVRRGR